MHEALLAPTDAPLHDRRWLIAIAYWLSGGFIKSGLGNRIAYAIVSTFGKTTLGLTYSLVFAEALLAPAIPSVSHEVPAHCTHPLSCWSSIHTTHLLRHVSMALFAAAGMPADACLAQCNGSVSLSKPADLLQWSHVCRYVACL